MRYVSFLKLVVRLMVHAIWNDVLSMQKASPCTGCVPISLFDALPGKIQLTEASYELPARSCILPGSLHDENLTSLLIPSDFAPPVFAFAQSVILHTEHCRSLGHHVHFPAEAAALACASCTQRRKAIYNHQLGALAKHSAFDCQFDPSYFSLLKQRMRK